VECLGWLSRDQLLETIRNAEVVVVPSEWYEPFGLTVVEAFASGVPVIASRLGSLESMIVDKKTGLLFEPGNAADLAAQVRWMLVNRDAARAMRRQARLDYEQKYTGETNYKLLMGIYGRALETYRAPQEGSPAAANDYTHSKAGAGCACDAKLHT